MLIWGENTSATAGRTMIGFAVMFSFMTINYAGLGLFREFLNNTWIRQAVNRPPLPAFLLGKLLPVAFAALAQLAFFWTLAIVLMDVPLHGDPLQLAVTALLLVCCGSLLGVVLYNLTHSVLTFQSITFLLLLGMGGVGGTIVVPERLPEISRALSLLTPHYWAMQALRESTVGGGSWGPTLKALLVIAGMIAVLTWIAIATFDYTREKSTLS
jgi:ABC-2 type transport system permease protein